MFKENELVMYGSTGVCRVVKIGTPDFCASSDQLYYFLEPVYQNGIIYAPVDNDKIEIRPVISPSEAKKLLDAADTVEPEKFSTHSMQQLSLHYQQIIDTHNCRKLLQMAKTIYCKAMAADRDNKRLGQIDKRFMKRAEDLLYGELAAALGTDRDNVERTVRAKFSNVECDEKLS
jgi:CarD family transcriptional regulator